MLAQQTSFQEHFLAQDRTDPLLQAYAERYELAKLVVDAKNEREVFLILNAWAHHWFTKFGHPSVKTEDAAAIIPCTEAGHIFYCAQYVIVYVVAATALGYHARPVSIRLKDYPDPVSNHNVVEIWSEEYQKWMMICPTELLFMSKDNVPLNCYEIGCEWHKNRGADIDVRFGPEQKKYRPTDEIFVHHYPNFGDIKFTTKAMDKYAKVAHIPTNQLLGQHAGKSIEFWEHWEHVHVTDTTDPASMCEATALAPYYNPT